MALSGRIRWPTKDKSLYKGVAPSPCNQVRYSANRGEYQEGLVFRATLGQPILPPCKKPLAIMLVEITGQCLVLVEAIDPDVSVHKEWRNGNRVVRRR